MTKILVLLLSFSAFAMGAAVDPQFLKTIEPGVVMVSHPPDAQWKDRDFVCVYHGDKAVACGVIQKIEPAGATVRLDFTESEQLLEGDPIAKPRTGKVVAPVALVETSNVWLSPYTPSKNLMKVGLMFDLDQVYFTAAVDRAVTSHVSWGAKFDLYDVFDVNKGISAYGFALTRSFYTLPYHHGVGVQVGLGPYFFNSTESGPGASFLAEFNVAWRFELQSWMTLGCVFGVRWIPKPFLGGYSMGPTAYHPLRGALGIDLSVRF
jgi:hypothetical protein